MDNEKKIWDIFFETYNTNMIFVAIDLDIFQLLSQKPFTLKEISCKLKITERAARAVLLVCQNKELVYKEKGKYYITEFSKKFLLEDSRYNLVYVFKHLLENPENMLTYPKLKKSVLSSKQQISEATDTIFDDHEKNKNDSFIKLMHTYSINSASSWPQKVNLSKHKILLDIGGGSGVHSINAVLTWENINAIVFELGHICKITERYLKKEGLINKITTHSGDFFADPYPNADIHFYSDIFHDWPFNEGEKLLKKSYESLEKGGIIVIHEMLLDNDMKGPAAVIGFNAAMQLWTEGQQYSGEEFTERLKRVGFKNIKIIKSEAYWDIILAEK